MLVCGPKAAITCKRETYEKIVIHTGRSVLQDANVPLYMKYKFSATMNS
jgi:hypothetical protein